jgi:hypothetical protein
MAFNPKYTITPKINRAFVEIERMRDGEDGFFTKRTIKD